MTPLSRPSSPLGISIQRDSQNDIFDTFKVDGISFTLFKKHLTSIGDLTLNYKDSNIILLHKVSAEKDIRINCIHLIALSQIESLNGACTISPSGKLLSLGAKFNAASVELSDGKEQIFMNPNTEIKTYIENRFRESLEEGKEDKFFDAIAQVVEVVSYPESVGGEYMLNSQIVDFYKAV